MLWCKIQNWVLVPFLVISVRVYAVSDNWPYHKHDSTPGKKFVQPNAKKYKSSGTKTKLAEVLLANPKATKLVDLYNKKWRAERDMPEGLTREQQNSYRKWNEQQAEKSLTGNAFSSSFGAEVLRGMGKEAAKFGTGGLEMALGPLYSIPAKGIISGLENTGNDFLKSFDTEGVTPIINPQEAKAVMVYLLNASQDSSNPEHQWAQRNLQKLGVDPNVPFEFNLDVQQKTQFERLGQNMALVKDQMKKIDTQFADIIGAMKEKTDISNAEEYNAEKREEKAAAIHEVSEALGGMAQILRAQGQDTKVVRRVAGLSQLGYQAEKLARLKSFASTPGAYVNGYATAGVIILDLLSEGSEEQGGQEILSAQLDKLLELIKEMGKQINERLDHIDIEMKQYFERSQIDIHDVQGSLERIESLSRYILDRQLKAHQDMIVGFTLNMKREFINSRQKCLPARAQAKLSTGQVPLDLIGCQTAFASLAVSPWDYPVVDSQSDQSPQKVGPITESSPKGFNVGKRFSVMKDLITEFDPTSRINQTLINPENWLWGVRSLLQLFTRYPKISSIQKDQDELWMKEFGLREVYNKGFDLYTALNELALEPLKMGKQRGLKKALFEQIISRYGSDVKRAIIEVKDPAKLDTLKPHPSMGYDSDIPNLRYDPEIGKIFPFLDTPVDFCREVEKKQVKLGAVVVPHLGYIGNDASLKAALRNHGKGRLVLMNSLSRFNPEDFKLSPAFLTYIPNRLLWEYRSDPKKYNIRACFKGIEVPAFTIGVEHSFLDVKFHFDLELRFEVRDFSLPASQWQSITFKRLTVDKTEEERMNPFYPYIPEPNYSFVSGFWNGIPCARTCKAWEPIGKDPMCRFIVQKIKEDEFFTNLALEQDLRNETAKTKELEGFETKYEVAGTNRFKDALSFMVAFGLAKNNEAVRDFFDYLNYPYSMPSSATILKNGYEAGVTKKELLQYLDTQLEVLRQHVEDISLQENLEPLTDDIRWHLIALGRLVN
jgi:hypothetical protein